MEATREMIRKIANLAALGILENEELSFAADLNTIIGYMEQLADIDTGDFKPMEHVLPLKNILREDQPANGNRRDELTACAPAVSEGCYTVPSVVES